MNKHTDGKFLSISHNHTLTNLPGIKLQREGPGPYYPSIQEQQTPVLFI